MSILRALVRLGDRLGSDGTAPTFGFSRENIFFAVVLVNGGAEWDVVDLRDPSGKKPRPQRLDVPRPEKRSGTQPPPNFLWDNTAYTLGVTRDRETNRAIPTERRHAAFKDHHREMLEECNDAGAQALLHFLDTWRVADYESLRHKADMLGTNIVFRLDGEGKYLHERDAIRQIWLEHVGGATGSRGLCLVTGAHAAIARLHPRIKGVAGGQPGGGDIVSFNEQAFESYGKKQGANAPVSERAASAYTTALNTLLERNSRQHIRIADTTAVFWAEAARTEAARAEDLIAKLLEPPTDAEETSQVAIRLAAVAKGQPLELEEVDPNLDPNTRFYVLGLAPNAGRISVRFWCEDTIGAIARRISEHWSDLRLEPTPWRTAPAAWRLLSETAVQHKGQNIPPTLTGALMRAILHGGRYPQSLFAAIVARMRADKDVTGSRAAICKACLARDHRLGFEQEDVPVSLNRSETNTAYRLGRLFAVYESVQRAALGKVNATIKDRYFGAASAAPASVFPLLERGSTSHLASLRKGDKGGLAHWYEREIDEILAGIQTEFPRSLRLADQGRFAIGYHHQRATKGSTDHKGSADPQVGNTESRSAIQDEE
ncbi:MAG: type I-C CRISPR-associated protein Cas8c/Csd1 [Acidobacteria bacterium]|nr:type I-C CRISPR-associated protein Cas8c/Csd1 [Acidobacteriota bacterium]